MILRWNRIILLMTIWRWDLVSSDGVLLFLITFLRNNPIQELLWFLTGRAKISLQNCHLRGGKLHLHAISWDLIALLMLIRFVQRWSNRSNSAVLRSVTINHSSFRVAFNRLLYRIVFVNLHLLRYTFNIHGLKFAQLLLTLTRKYLIS